MITKLRDTAQRYVQQVYTPNRSIELGSDTFTVKMEGLNVVSSLHKASTFSYRDVESVSVGPIDGISLFAPRLGYSNPLTGARAGRFRTKGRHILASYSSPVADILTITLRQHSDDPTKFDMVQLQIAAPRQIAQKLREKTSIKA